MSLEIVFITSSKIKLAHAQHLCRDYNINITSYRIKHYGVGYEEPRIYNREQLLDESYKDALDRWKKYTSNNDKMFIIEDTSVRIDALSDKVNEVPGLDIKYWMKENSFESVDKLLKSKGNNRKCTVRSDIILHLTDDLSKKYKKDYLQFTSTTDGCIVDKEFELNTNPIYPWLDNKTFNKWFVPNGENLPMSKLSIELADKYDFRSGAFNSMLDLLELADKIPKDSYKQIYLNFNPLYIICGPTCAGKSTLSKYLSDNYSYFHIEASDFMWLKYHEKHGINSDVTITNFAKKALVDEPSIVTDQIIEFIKQKNLKKVIISGFRSEKEIEFIKNSNIDINDKIEIYVDANIDIRYDREVRRKRKDHVSEKNKFVEKDQKQLSMGLDIIRNQIKNILINEYSFDQLYKEFDTKYMHIEKYNFKYKITQKYKKLKLETAILLALFKYEDKFYTTTEISKIINEEILENSLKHKDNISRYFNQRFYPYYDVEYEEEKQISKYKINYTGISQIKYLLEHM